MIQSDVELIYSRWSVLAVTGLPVEGYLKFKIKRFYNLAKGTWVGWEETFRMDGGMASLASVVVLRRIMLGFPQEEAVAGEDVKANMDNFQRTMWQFYDFSFDF